MDNKSPFGRKLISAFESVDVFKKLKQADKRKMARVQKRSDQLEEAFDRAKINRNLATSRMNRIYGFKDDFHSLTPLKEKEARAKRLKKR
jgi:hypothetical protein